MLFKQINLSYYLIIRVTIYKINYKFGCFYLPSEFIINN